MGVSGEPWTCPRCPSEGLPVFHHPSITGLHGRWLPYNFFLPLLDCLPPSHCPHFSVTAGSESGHFLPLYPILIFSSFISLKRCSHLPDFLQLWPAVLSSSTGHSTLDQWFSNLRARQKAGGGADSFPRESDSAGLGWGQRPRMCAEAQVMPSPGALMAHSPRNANNCSPASHPTPSQSQAPPFHPVFSNSDSSHPPSHQPPTILCLPTISPLLPFP